LAPADPIELAKKADAFNEYRRRTQPPGASLGSMFKNPAGDAAGRLIDQCGLKGTRVGDAEISTVHANFFINHGQAKASDVKTLIDLAQQRVKETFGVELELEIELLGEWG
jgi:UDP-N-acetylmuramate dehydrogenase